MKCNMTEMHQFIVQIAHPATVKHNLEMVLYFAQL